jgi:hypothetical protein
VVGFCEYGTELLGYLEGSLFLKRDSDLWTSYGPYHNSLCDNNVRVFDVTAAVPTRSSLLRNVTQRMLLVVYRRFGRGQTVFGPRKQDRYAVPNRG